ncbi:hypothetical protein N7466_000819 [Penicillium verhagenii]|uniref:uncharacterized protein n=1 Tax=Penicillium verhagenii TaxID=1562060 RepID=UPI002545515F|nr:uncharacterized protein N7466_000819 [Penicillium verhagenii]KAJ5947804.1 hypothetical protein N7466_000819 [Penicillium verhagenii]
MTRMKPGVFSWEDVLTQRYQSNKPPPLPRSRRRTLTTAQPQPQCQLLSRLSPELRLMIWEMVLGAQRLHIIQRNHQRLGHIVCPLGIHRSTSKSDNACRARDNSPTCDICDGHGIPQPVKEGDLAHSGRKAGLLSPALTCRQMYHESIHLLYTLNTFEFSNPWSLPYMRPTIPAEHWDCIRSVELRWSFQGHWLPSKDPVRTIYVSAGRAQWLETCRALARLPTLQSFVLVLGDAWFCEPVEKLPGFLEPLRGLRVQRRSGARAEDAEVDEYELGAGGSDEESGLSLSSSLSSSSGFEIGVGGSDGGSISENTSVDRGTSTILHSYCSFYSSLPSPSTTDIIPLPIHKTDGLAAWELRLQGQPYYVHELGRMGDDLRRRGIDCCISTM